MLRRAAIRAPVALLVASALSACAREAEPGTVCDPATVCGIVDTCGGEDWPTRCEALSVELLVGDEAEADYAVRAVAPVDADGRFCLDVGPADAGWVVVRWTEEPTCRRDVGAFPGGELSAGVDPCDPPADLVLSPGCVAEDDML